MRGRETYRAFFTFSLFNIIRGNHLDGKRAICGKLKGYHIDTLFCKIRIRCNFEPISRLCHVIQPCFLPAFPDPYYPALQIQFRIFSLSRYRQLFSPLTLDSKTISQTDKTKSPGLRLPRPAQKRKPVVSSESFAPTSHHPILHNPHEHPISYARHNKILRLSHCCKLLFVRFSICCIPQKARPQHLWCSSFFEA